MVRALRRARADFTTVTVLEEPTIRDTLRARTDDVHRRLERTPCLVRVVAGQASFDDYTKLLRAYLDFYTQAEMPLRLGFHTLSTFGLNANERHCRALLEADLASLGAARMPRTETASPASCSPAEAVGWVWVTEGSALGAQVIDRALDSLFGKQREGRRFFETRSDQSLRWRTVCASMQHYGRLQDALEPLVSGALSAFDCIERSFMRIER